MQRGAYICLYFHLHTTRSHACTHKHSRDIKQNEMTVRLIESFFIRAHNGSGTIIYVLVLDIGVDARLACVNASNVANLFGVQAMNE